MTTGPVDIEDLADDLLALADVVTDILDLACCNFRDGDEPLAATILVERDEGYEVLDILYSADNQFRFLWPFSVLHGRYHWSSWTISALKLALPPAGVARSCPQTTHLTVVLAFSKTVCSFSQSGHFTFKNLLRFSRIVLTIV